MNLRPPRKENIMAETKYPHYMWHKNQDKPLLVANKDEERQLAEKGYQSRYIHKDYPKWVNGRIVPNKAAHEALLANQPKVSHGPLPEEQVAEPRRGRRG